MRKSKKYNTGFFLTAFFGVVLLLLISFGIFLFVQFSKVKENVFLNNTVYNNNLTVKLKNESFIDHIKNKTPFNILLLGYGGGSHDGTYLTDSLIVVHIDPEQKKITLISLPRDIWVKVPTNETGTYWKINATYQIGLDDKGYPKKPEEYTGAVGGGNLVKYVIGLVIGLPIERFVAVDFDGFIKTIDILDGVNVNVEKTFDDYEYPIEGKEDDLCGRSAADLPELVKIATSSNVQAFPCRYEHLHFDQGNKVMNGETALKYVRSRHSLQDGTDFGRSARQRNLLIAAKQRVFSLDFITKIIPFINSIQNNIKTDLTIDEVKYLIDQANTLNSYQVSNLALSDQNVLKQYMSDDGQSALVAKEGIGTWEGVHDWIASNIDPSRINSSPLVKIENGTRISGLAAVAYNRLQDRDFNLLSPASANDQDVEKTKIVIYSSSIDKKVIDDLKKEFSVSEVIVGQQKDFQYDILVILGQDYNNIQGKKLIN